MLSLLLPLLCPVASSDLVLDAPLPLQEPESAPLQEQEPEKKKKKKFARLTSPMKKELQAGLRLIEKGDPEEGEIEEGVTRLIAIGEAVIPSMFGAVKRMEKADRLEPHWQVVDALLVDDDLPLAWTLLKKKSPDSLRLYLVRRWADSSLEGTAAFLKGFVDHEHPDLAYEAARGLARRGFVEAVPAIEAQVAKHWLKEADRLRADFAGVERGPLVSAIMPLMQRKFAKEKLAGIRMFELFGVEEQARVLSSFLSESDTTLRLAAINACRVVVAKEEPLGKPSMTEIIERAEAWKAKL
ncbi:MAG: hypothetical protein ACYTEP_02475 [Planctomycetota bacterium]|jgi:hypothetical protein